MGQNQSPSAEPTKENNDPITPVELRMLINECGISPQRVDQLLKQFKQSFPSGKIKRVEFVKFYREHFGHGVSEIICNRVFKAIDTNNSDDIDFQEFMNFVQMVERGSETERLRWMFRLYDLDKSKSVSQNELEELLEKIYLSRHVANAKVKAAENATRLVRRMSTTADRKEELTEEEFVGAAAGDDHEVMKLLLGI